MNGKMEKEQHKVDDCAKCGRSRESHKLATSRCGYVAPSRVFQPPQRKITPSELATVLHGLRMIQCEGRIEGCAAGDCEHFEDDKHELNNEQIDALCDAINFGKVQL